MFLHTGMHIMLLWSVTAGSDDLSDAINEDRKRLEDNPTTGTWSAVLSNNVCDYLFRRAPNIAFCYHMNS